MSLRLSKMLVKQKVDFQHYLFSQSEPEILQQIHNCMRCRKPDDCDAYLATRHSADMEYAHFCPNYQLICRLRKQ